MLPTLLRTMRTLFIFYIKVIRPVLGPLKIKKSTENAKNDMFCMFFVSPRVNPQDTRTLWPRIRTRDGYGSEYSPRGLRVYP